MEFGRVIKNIRSLKVQGAENIARESVDSLRIILKNSKARTAKELYRELEAARKSLVGARPTEPCMRNALNYVMNNVDRKDVIRLSEGVSKRIKEVLSYFDDAERKIAEIGANTVRKNYAVFTHCHSSTVMMVLAKARFSGTRFVVHNTETRPKFQGRRTAKELSALGIKVFHYVDSAARLALKKCDLFLFGADAVQSDGRIINKIGTELFLEIAERYDIPAYCCAVSWKFDPLTVYDVEEPMENRNPEEVWGKSPKNITIMNPAFEIIEPRLVTGVISELGVYKPEVFVDIVRRERPWMFKK